MSLGPNPFAFPLGGGGSTSNPSLDAQKQTQQDTFGTDLYFNGGLVLNAKGDYLTVPGIDNLRQSIANRLSTNPGEHRINPSYGVGIPAYVQQKLTQSSLDEMTHRIKDNLSQDPRIDSIISVDLTPTTFGNLPGLTIRVVAKAKGNNITFEPFAFTRS